MSGFDPGPGWREVERPDAAMRGEVVSYRAPRGGEPRVRTWVREEPVPDLPVEPYTVIRATWDDAKAVLVLIDGRWLWVNPNAESDAEQLSAARVEVLAEPRAVTVKRVFDRIAELDQQGIAPADVIDRAATGFGAAS